MLQQEHLALSIIPFRVAQARHRCCACRAVDTRSDWLETCGPQSKSGPESVCPRAENVLTSMKVENHLVCKGKWPTSSPCHHNMCSSESECIASHGAKIWWVRRTSPSNWTSGSLVQAFRTLLVQETNPTGRFSWMFKCCLYFRRLVFTDQHEPACSHTKFRRYDVHVFSRQKTTHEIATTPSATLSSGLVSALNLTDLIKRLHQHSSYSKRRTATPRAGNASRVVQSSIWKIRSAEVPENPTEVTRVGQMLRKEPAAVLFAIGKIMGVGILSIVERSFCDFFMQTIRTLQHQILPSLWCSSISPCTSGFGFGYSHLLCLGHRHIIFPVPESQFKLRRKEVLNPR